MNIKLKQEKKPISFQLQTVLPLFAQLPLHSLGRQLQKFSVCHVGVKSSIKGDLKIRTLCVPVT